VKTDTQPEIRRYLATVEREAAPLPTEERRGLVADLDEHIQVALAERPDALAEILAELGDPRAIATTALKESDAADPARERPDLPRICISLWAVSSIAGYLSPLPGCDFLTPVAVTLTIAALVVLYRSPWWTAQRKWVAFLLLYLPNVALNELIGAVGGGRLPRICIGIVELALRAGVLTWLWRVRTAPDPAATFQPTRRWVRNLLIGVLAVIVLALIIAATTALWTFHGLSDNVVTGKL